VVLEHIQNRLATSEEHRPIQNLQDFHMAIADRRRADRGTNDRRSTPRPYASPWMARPADGSIDPRPLAQPEHDAAAPIIRALDTVVPALPLPLPQEDPAPHSPVAFAPPAAMPAPSAPAAPPAPEVAAQVPAPDAARAAEAQAPLPDPSAQQTQSHSTPGDPLGGVFGAPSAVRFAVINPTAWFPAMAAPQDSATTEHVAPAPAPVVTAAPATPPAPAAPSAPTSPWADRTPPAQPSPVATAMQLPAAAPPVARPWGDARPSITAGGPAAAAPHPISAPPAAQHALATTPAIPPLTPLASQITGMVALQPAGSTATTQARNGSIIVRFAWMVVAPAAAGAGIGYLLSMLLR
jgi:hypothetical protein